MTYQDDLIATLNQVVVELRRELETVAKSVAKLEQQLLAGMPEEAANEPPPHY